MMQTTSSPAAQRLDRLAAYLKEDPGNPALLADACEAAIASGQHGRAQEYIETAERLALDRAEWVFRGARLAIARRDLAHAALLLESLLESGGPHPVVAHDLAYVRLLSGDLEGARDLLAAWVDPAAADGLPPAQQQALQVLWLRAQHRLQAVDAAVEWVRARHEAGALQPAAQGVASLIAYDAGELDLARDLAAAALAADPAQVEALVASGSLALEAGDTALAARYLQGALQRNPDDGRTWSALGFTSLQAMDLPSAQAQLERAVSTMADHAETWQALGWTRLLQGDREGALAALRQALDLDRGQADSHAALALALVMGGEAAQAETHLSEAERLDPDNAMARYARGLAAGHGVDPDMAQSLVRSLLGQAGGAGLPLQAMLRSLAGKR